jgi:hypothetical protein
LPEDKQTGVVEPVIAEVIGNALTVMRPVEVGEPQPPMVDIVYVNVPATVGVPLMVMLGEAQLLLTPAGKPDTIAPVAPVIEYAILAIAALMHTDCVAVVPAEVSVMELPAVTVILPVAVAVPQPPVGVIV